MNPADSAGFPIPKLKCEITMVNALDSLVLSIVELLDHLRSLILRVTLSNEILKTVFRNRAYRLFSMYLLIVFQNLVLSLFFPLWVLVIGPVLYGMPHLFSSFRYVHYSLAGEKQRSNLDLRRNAFRFFAGIFVCIFGFRILIDFDLFPQLQIFEGFIFPEIVSVFVTILGCAWIYRTSWVQTLTACTLTVPLILSAWYLPYWIDGALLLLHNWIGFFYWLGATKSQSERRVAWAALLIFTGLNGLIFSGYLDFLYHLFSPTAQIRWAEMDYSLLGKLIAPWSGDYIVWFHCVVAYAFGQSMHYFVWMKAIPDQNHYHEIPTSFRQSYRFLVDDFGKKITLLIFTLVLIMAAAWILLKYPNARILYLAAASYHGFLEIAGLGIMWTKSIRSGLMTQRINS